MRQIHVQASMTVAALVAGVFLVPLNVDAQDAAEGDITPVGVRVVGTFAPNGPPVDPPTRINVSDKCVIDLHQSYEVAGGLVGTFEIDYRILTFGPCTSTPATYDEEWIAHGTFSGSVRGAAAKSNLVYTATVQSGGAVTGHIVLGEGLVAELEISGSFADGRLAYDGYVQ